MVRPDWRVDAPPVVILLLAARLAPWDGSSANADCGVVSRGVVRSVNERRAVAAAEKRSWMMELDACNCICDDLAFKLGRPPLGENAAAPPHAAAAMKAVWKETIILMLIESY